MIQYFPVPKMAPWLVNGREPIRLQAIDKTQLQEILADMLMQHCHREVSC